MIDTSTIKGKVQYCLEKWEVCRNDDKWLIGAVWVTFYKRFIKDGEDKNKYINIKDIVNLPSTETIRRIRQKFQEEGIYSPLEEVKINRIEREEYIRNEIIKPVNEVNLYP